MPKKVKKEQKTVLILDGDSIAYKCAAATEKRYIQVKHTPSGVEKIFKNKTEFKSYMQEKGKEITDKYDIFDCQEPASIAVVLRTIQQHIKKIQKYAQAHRTVIFAGECDNLRLKLDLPSKYKGNRKDNLRPVHLEAAKEYLRTVYKAKMAEGHEVDDACCISAYESLQEGDKAVMFLYDKDQCSFDGVHLILEEESSTEKTFKEMLTPDLGYLTYEKNTVKGFGYKFLAFQWIYGDKTDAFCSYELSKIKFGAKSAYDLLKDLSTKEEVSAAVVQQFKKFYPEPVKYTTWDGREVEKDWKGFMQMYFMCCRMKRTLDDDLDCFKLLKERGWNE